MSNLFENIKNDIKEKHRDNKDLPKIVSNFITGYYTENILHTAYKRITKHNVIQTNRTNVESWYEYLYKTKDMKDLTTNEIIDCKQQTLDVKKRSISIRKKQVDRNNSYKTSPDIYEILISPFRQNGEIVESPFNYHLFMLFNDKFQECIKYKKLRILDENTKDARYSIPLPQLEDYNTHSPGRIERYQEYKQPHYTLESYNPIELIIPHGELNESEIKEYNDNITRELEKENLLDVNASTQYNIVNTTKNNKPVFERKK